ncbi:MAG: putative bifunctional diguanylate cyclase/phosphodiesterase [Solirubrobacteraceae bacterium]
MPLWKIYLGCGALVTVLYTLVPPFRGYGPIMNLLGLSGIVAVIVGMRRNHPRYRLPWLLFAFGLFLFWVGDIYTYSYPQLTGAVVPFPSFGDAVYLCVYPVLMAGLLLLVRQRNPQRDRAGVIDAMIMTLGLALVSWIALIAPYVHVTDMTLVQKLVSIAYPTGDILLLAAAIRLAVDGGKREPAFYLLALSIVTLLVTDFTYGVVTLHNAYDHQLILDVGWIGFYLLWGAAALHPSMRELELPAPDRQPRLTWMRLALLTCATLIAPAIELTKEVRRGDLDLVITIAVSGILFALVVARMAGLVRQRERHIASERILAASAADIVAATSREQIYEAALTAVPCLVDEGVLARLYFITEGVADVVALEDEDGPCSTTTWSVPAASCPSLLDQVPADGHGLTSLIEDELAALRLPSSAASVHVLELPLRGDERTRGLLLVAGERAGSLAAHSALVALGTQVSLALESSALTEELHRRSSEARFRSLVQHTHDLITVLDSNATVIYQSPSIERSLGYAPEEIAGTQFDRLLVPAQSVRLLHLLADGPAHSGSDGEVIECSLRHRNGSIRQFEILYTNLLHDDAVHGIVLNGRDISERKTFEAQLEHQAFHDPVTLLPNRALLNERVRHALARTRREQGSLAVIFLDLNDFKTINDSLGHAAGDLVLLEVAKRLSTSIRASDTAARFGGDEFAILLEQTTGPEEVADTAERIMELLKRPLHVEGKEIVVRASMGIAVCDHQSTADADELIRNADAAMYIAKRDGKGSYRLFEPTMHSDVLARLELRGDLQRALVNDEFELHYQPVMSLTDGTIRGMEALVRWRHPERGLIGPDEFIPFAEETGLIIPLGRWVLREGCRQAKAIQDQLLTDPPLSMNINLSVNQLHHSDIVADVRDALRESGIVPQSLTLEITETVMMTDADLAEQRLGELKQLGVKVALDDFGTGYSSLGYLARFPVDVIKMDRSFLQPGATPITSGLATAVIGLGKTLELDVVAEGIEFPEQWATLRGLGCELGQGFYFAKPMDASTMIEYLRSCPEVVFADQPTQLGDARLADAT